MSNTLTSVISLLSVLLCLCSIPTVESAPIDLAQSSDTCLFNNQIFQRGESYDDSFATRCGSAADFPCYCNPDLSPPIECNYCSFALQGGGLLCARDEEVVRFTDMKGNDQTCSCQATSGMNPTSECREGFAGDYTDHGNNDNSDNANDNTDNSNGSDNGGNQDDSCLIELPNSAQKIVPNGEYIYEKANKCGDDFPCLCNLGQIECPYCTFNTIDDGVICARNNESTIFEGKDFKLRSCTCQMDLDAPEGFTFSSECTELTTYPTMAPTPTISTPSPTINATFVVRNLACELLNDNGNIVVVEHGASFGSLLQGKCGPAEQWPSFCNKQSSQGISRTSPDDVEYPYCVFENTYSGEIVCARDNEEVTFLDDKGFDLACSCWANKGSRYLPVPSCRDASREQTSSFTWPPTNSPKVPTASASSNTVTALAVVTILLSVVQMV